MHEPTRFGEFLLLKKLSEDPLGEIYRAGRVAGHTVGELVLLRIYSIPDLDPNVLVASMEAYRGSRETVHGPGVVHFKDCGEVGGVAYSAYEYTPGWDLKTLAKTASDDYNDLEIDHAVLLVERLAKGLGQVHQTEQGRPFHGFLTPHMVRITDEGEIQILGFEVGPSLGALAHLGHLDPALRPYISPEALAGGAPSPRDDVYSLGAIFFELLTAKVPPEDASAQLSTMLATSKLANGEALPDGLAELLQRCLASARGRSERVDVWYRLLTAWMGQVEIKMTHFDLAFFVHELFRTQIKSEKEEVEKEKKIDLSPKPEPEPAVVPQAVPVMPEPSGTGVYASPPPKRTNPGLIIAVAAVAIAAIAIIIFMMAKKAPPPPPPQVVETQAAPAPPPPRSGGLMIAQEELERLLDERAEAMSEELAGSYDEEIRLLQEQLEQAQAEEKEALRQIMEEQDRTARSEAPAVTPTGTEDRVAATPPPEKQRESATPAAPDRSGPPRSVPPPSVPPPSVSSSAVPSSAVPSSTSPTPAAPSGTTPRAAPEKAVPKTPPESPPSAPPENQPARPAPRPSGTPETGRSGTGSGSAVTPAHQPVIIPPSMIRMPEPSYPRQARQLSKQATILIKVLVDSDGKVQDAQPVSSRTFGYGFDAAALRAARSATFKPATRDGEGIEMWTTVVIRFKLQG